MACVEIRLCLAMHVNRPLGCCVINAARIGFIGSSSYTLFWVTGSILVISGTAPGVLLRVCQLCVRGVFLRWCFAMGFLDVMIGGASVIR